MGENIYNTPNRLISQIYKQLRKLNIQKPNHPIKKWTKDLNRHFFKEYIQMATGHTKRHSISLIVWEMQIKTMNTWDITSLKSESVQFSTVAQSYPTLCDPMDCSTPSLPVHHQLQEFTQTHAHWVGDATQPSHPLSSPSTFPSIRVFSNESALHIRWPKYYNFSVSVSPSNEYSGQISFRMDWLDLLVEWSQNGHHQKIYKQEVLERVWKREVSELLVGM